MRIFEILIIASLLLTWVFSITRLRSPLPRAGSTLKYGKAARAFPVWLSGAGLALVALHLVFEGYRWQMVPAYALVVIFFLLALWRAAASGRDGLPAAQESSRPLALCGAACAARGWMRTISPYAHHKNRAIPNPSASPVET